MATPATSASTSPTQLSGTSTLVTPTLATTTSAVPTSSDTVLTLTATGTWTDTTIITYPTQVGTTTSIVTTSSTQQTSSTFTLTTTLGVTSTPGTTPLTSATGNATTTSTSPTSTPTSKPAPSNPKSDVGPVVGAAIGCLIAGLILGFLIAWCLNRRKRQQGYNNTYSPPPATELKAFDPPPQPAQQPLPVQDKEAIQLNQFLLDALPDKELAGELQALETLIQQHVENNYHLQHVQVDSRALASSLTQLGVGEGGSLTPDAVVALALDPKSRYFVLRHVISKVVFTSIDVGSRSRLSMLPAPVAAFLQSIPSEGHHGGSDNQASSLALSRWRVLSAFLLHPNRSQRTPLPASDAAMAPQAKSLANALDTFLAPFVLGDEASRFQQKSHLQAVIVECAKFGYVLLSQPSEWAFVHVPDWQGRTAVVCAGLAKVGDRDGRRYGSPLQVVAPKGVQV